FPTDATRPDELVAVADEALYLAKPAAARRGLEQRDADLALLVETAAALMTTADAGSLPAIIVERAVALAGAADGVLYLVDEAAEQLVPAATVGRPRGGRRALRHGEGLAGRAWATAAPVSGQTDTDSATAAPVSGQTDTDSAAGAETSTDHPDPTLLAAPRTPRRRGDLALAVPLVVADRVRGVVAVGRPVRSRHRGLRDHLALVRFAELAAIALDNAERAARAPREVPERARAEAELRAAEERFRRLADAAGQPLAIHRDGQILEVNEAFAALFGSRPAELVGRSLLDFVAPESLPVLTDHYRNHPDDAVELLARASDGTVFPVRVVGRPIPWGGGQARVASIRDLRAERGLEARLAKEARLDRVTGLLNRRALAEEMAVLVGAGRRGEAAPAGPRSGAALVLLDLDRFTTINESLGHAAGDDLLAAVAGRIGEICRPSDVAARVGSDEFAVLLPGVDDEEGARLVAERIVDALRTPIRVAGHDVFVSPSVGLAWAEAETDPEGLLRDAEIALHRAKEAGGGRIVLFEASMRAGRHERLDLEADLRRAIAGDQLRLHYQPIVDLEGRAIVGFEALVRWEHPTRGLVPPLAFVPLAEETGLIADIGRWVLREATRQAAAWQTTRVAARPAKRAAAGAGCPTPFVGINLSAREFADPDLVDHVRAALEATGLPPDRLELEITESVLMDEAGSGIGVLRALRGLGVRLVLDDFGTGYASLGYLSRLPLDAIKI
ncbi:MAG TPA: EAL domain-containing protein, partial [Candidatus Binatia bacterium]|nr:EAL domain-containing protein [Candidatus Binatia bacterium]